MSTRTYCVIPHEARQHSIFQGVFEDGVRVMYRGRLQSLAFSHVLSPAHEYVKHINGPLLATLRDGGSATLVLATPSSEDTATSQSTTTSDGIRSASQVQSNARATASRVSSSSALGQKSNTGLAAATEVVMELYAQLFPLIFRNLEGCSAVRLSVVTVSVSERMLLDNLHKDCRIRTIEEAHRQTLTRATSATEWGAVFQLLANRRVALEDSSELVECQTACVVTVELEGYGRLVVVDAASAQDLLQQLTLILHMHADGAARTYPLHTPLRDLLEHNVAPRATVQVVCIPAPQDSVRHTMRVLHFAATVEAAQSGWDSSMSIPLTSRSLQRRAISSSSAPSKFFSRPATSGASSATEVNSVRGKGSSSTPPPVRMQSALALDMGMETKRCSSSHGASSCREHTPAQLPPSNLQRDRHHEQVREQHLLQRITSLEEQLRSSEERCHIARATCEKTVEERNYFERELRTKIKFCMDLQRTHQALKEERDESAQLMGRFVRQGQLLQRETARHKREGAAIAKQLRQVEEEKEELRKQLTRLRKEILLFQKDAISRSRQTTQSRIVPSEVTVSAHQASEQRQPPQPRDVSWPMPSSLSSTSAGAAGRASPRARRVYDRTRDTEAVPASKGGDASSLAEEKQARLAAVTLDELRLRNHHLMQEVGRLQERLLATLSATSRRESAECAASDLMRVERHEGCCPMCGLMQERVEWFQKKLADVLHEKKEFQHPTGTSSSPLELGVSTTTNAANPERCRSEEVHSHSPSSEIRDHSSGSGGGVLNCFGSSPQSKASLPDNPRSVAAALLTGCASLSARLSYAQAELSRRRMGDAPASTRANMQWTDPLSQLCPLLLHEHQESVAALADALRCIVERPASRAATRRSTDLSVLVPEDGVVEHSLLPPVPHCATAADADTLASYLSFETERCQRLRAFIPTFAQLAVATEHLAMRLEASGGRPNSMAARGRPRNG